MRAALPEKWQWLWFIALWVAGVAATAALAYAVRLATPS